MKIGTYGILEVLIPNPDLEFWNSYPRIHFRANLGRETQSCLFCLKIGTHGISRMLILVPTIVFWIKNSKSIFGQIWAEKVKSCPFWMKIDTHTHTHTHTHAHTHREYLEDVDSYFNISFLKFQTYISRMLILILRLAFWNSKPKSIFRVNLSRKSWILHFAWKLVRRVSWGCDCKNTEQGLEAKIKMSNCIKY